MNHASGAVTPPDQEMVLSGASRGAETRHARQTCTKALVLLVDEGLLYRVPGLGYLVTRDARRRLGE